VIGLAQNVFGLTEKMGLLAGCLKKKIRDGAAYQVFDREIRREVGETLWYLASVCTHLGISLDDVASDNLTDNQARWGRSYEQPSLFSHLFDTDVPEHEQRPRRFTAQFLLRKTSDMSWLPVAQVYVGNQTFGDPIDDNTGTEDYYRLHDVLHIANAAILGWSPVVRALLKCKRKSLRDVDKYQDGARARDTEEALARLIHNAAKDSNYFENVTTLDTSFLITVQSVVADLEVKVRDASEWQHCILEAYRVFRLLRDHGGGLVDASLVDRTLTFRPLSQGSEGA